MARTLGLLATMIAMAVGLYLYSRQGAAISAVTPGGNLQATPVSIGVKNDLISIANAERGYMAEQGKYGSMDDLALGHYLSVVPERRPYAYDLESTDTGFRVTASTSAAGYPPQLWIDESMQVHTGN